LSEFFGVLGRKLSNAPKFGQSRNKCPTSTLNSSSLPSLVDPIAAMNLDNTHLKIQITKIILSEVECYALWQGNGIRALPSIITM
jgi:hypothetical protein